MSTGAADFTPFAARGTTRAEDLRNPSRLIRELTDIYVSRKSPTGAESLQYEDIACRLVPEADAPALAYVAARIASNPAAPVVLIDTLIKQHPACAKILVEHSSRVSPMHLLAFAEGEDPAMAAAVARRRKLSPALARALVERNDTLVLRDLASNPQLELTGVILDRLLENSRRDPVLARLLIARADDASSLAPLFSYASPEQRLQILSAAERQTFKAGDIKRIRLIGPALVNWLLKRNPARDWRRISRELARLIEQPAEAVEKLARDPRGDGLAILLAAAGMPEAEAVRFLLLCPPEISHSTKRVRALSRIVQNLPAHAARKLVGAIAGTQVETQPQHAPHSEAVTAREPRYQPLTDIAARSLPGRAAPAPTPAHLPANLPAPLPAAFRAKKPFGTRKPNSRTA
ncbi:MAG: DUF2336 domain-containing protein [Beijerinckiaceae bacterium]